MNRLKILLGATALVAGVALAPAAQAVDTPAAAGSANRKRLKLAANETRSGGTLGLRRFAWVARDKGSFIMAR